MRSPSLNELPPSSPEKIGWPWTEESLRLPPMMPDGHAWPCISVVTPSFNQGEFIEATIRSVLLQGYPNLEYFVLDGGSRDNSVEIIKKYSPWLRYWVSESDSGQSDAINRGLRMGSGLYATWINSDDMLCKNAFGNHASRIGFTSNTVYVGICAYIDVSGRIKSTHCGNVHSLEDLVRCRTVWRSGGQIVQPEVLFPRQLALAVGGLDPNNHYSMDYELWGKFFLAGARFQYTEIPFGMSRQHHKQKTRARWQATQSLVATATKLLTQANCFSDETRDEILTDLTTYLKDFWRDTGGLARIGLPPYIVMPLRDLRARLSQLKARLKRRLPPYIVMPLRDLRARLSQLKARLKKIRLAALEQDR